MRSFWKDILGSFEISRSRPYKKDDNRFVEQKNFTLVRAYLGYERLDTVDQTLALNQIYDKMWLYYNFFQPVMRMSEKTVIREEGRSIRIKRRYDDASTPLDRLCATKALAKERKDCLRAMRDRINPRQLRNEIKELLDGLFALPCAPPNASENVHDTLTYRIGDGEHGYCPTMQLPTALVSNKKPWKGEGQLR